MHEAIKKLHAYDVIHSVEVDCIMCADAVGKICPWCGDDGTIVICIAARELGDYINESINLAMQALLHFDELPAPVKDAARELFFTLPDLRGMHKEFNLQ